MQQPKTPTNQLELRQVEPFATMSEAAEALGLHLWQVQRAVKAGLIPSYRAFNGRPRVRVSEIASFIEGSRQGGNQ